MTFILILIAALGSGLIAGTFFAFSTFVMQSLARLPASEGVAAMQSINLVILKSPFMPVFFGTAVLSVLALIQSLRQWHEPHAAWLLAGGSLYLAGSLLVTVAFNVPRNIALDAVRPGAPTPQKNGLATLKSGRGGTMCEPSPRWLHPPLSAWHSSRQAIYA